MRGEYQLIVRYMMLPMELPPRARRIPEELAKWTDDEGTTSACAENTHPDTGHEPSAGNYLRVRGEYCEISLCDIEYLELPPRARRIHLIAPIGDVDHGTTSACAENTLNELGLL